MSIREADYADLDNVMSLIEACIKDMESQNIYQWIWGFYPTRDFFEKDVKHASLFLLENEGRCLGIISIDENQPPEYEALKWFVNNSKILVIHRLAVAPDFQGQGIGHRLLDFAENFALKTGYASIRLDAYSGNLRAINFYENRGYKKVAAELYFPQRELPFYCYEKNL